MTLSESVFSCVKGVRASWVSERTESVHIVGVLNAYNISLQILRHCCLIRTLSEPILGTPSRSTFEGRYFRVFNFAFDFVLMV